MVLPLSTFFAIEIAENRVGAGGRFGSIPKGTTQIRRAAFRHTGMRGSKGARLMDRWIDASKGDKLLWVVKVGDITDLGEDHGSRDGANALDGMQEAREAGIALFNSGFNEFDVSLHVFDLLYLELKLEGEGIIVDSNNAHGAFTGGLYLSSLLLAQRSSGMLGEYLSQLLEGGLAHSLGGGISFEELYGSFAEYIRKKGGVFREDPIQKTGHLVFQRRDGVHKPIAIAAQLLEFSDVGALNGDIGILTHADHLGDIPAIYAVRLGLSDIHPTHGLGLDGIDYMCFDLFVDQGGKEIEPVVSRGLHANDDRMVVLRGAKRLKELLKSFLCIVKPEGGTQLFAGMVEKCSLMMVFADVDANVH